MERVILPDAAWRRREGFATLCDALGAGEGRTRVVGGAVRDTLLGLDVADIDLATRHAPDRVLALLKGNGIRAVPTGLAHGTITAILPDGAPVEVTTLRCDIATDGRHATVAFTDDWREDAARRDFTINALYADPPTGELFDYFGGIDDLARRRVRFIGDPLKRIAEDHLRILRFFRFQARFGEGVDAGGLAACEARANDLMALSRERVAAELLKLLVAPRAVETVALMLEHGILAPVLPEIDGQAIAVLARVAQAELAAGLSPDPIRRLAALLPSDPKIGEDVAARLKLSTVQRKRIVSAVRPQLGDARALAYALRREGALDRFLIHDPAPSDAVRDIIGWTAPSLPITGGAVVARGVGKGPDVARLLRQIEQQWVAENFPDAARVEQIADATVDQFRRASSIA